MSAIAALPLEDQELISVWLSGIYTSQWIDACCMGILAMQFARYLKNSYETDSWPLRGIVIFTLMLNLGGSIFIQVWCSDLFITEFGSLDDVTANRWWATLLFLSPIQSAPVQVYYATKAYKLYGRSIYVLLGLLLLILASVAGGINARVAIGRGSLGVVSGTYLIASVNIWLWSSVVADLLISTLITVKFIRSRTGWSATNTLLRKLIKLTWESSLPPTLFALATVIDFQFRVTHLKYPWNMLSAKVYGLTLLYGLNERAHLRSRPDGSFKVEQYSSAPDFAQDNFVVMAPADAKAPRGGDVPLNVLITKDQVTSVSDFTDKHPDPDDSANSASSSRHHLAPYHHSHSSPV